MSDSVRVKMNFRDICCICRRSMAKGKLVRLHPCGHLYDKKCWTQYRGQPDSERCCICREVPESVTDVVRKKYAKNEQKDRERIVRAARDLRNWSDLAKAMGIKHKTAYRWVREDRVEHLPRINSVRKALNEDQINGLISFLETDPALTMNQMADFLRETYEKSLSKSTISRYLHGRVFSYKNNHYQPVATNTPEKKILRKEYVDAIIGFITEGKYLYNPDYAIQIVNLIFVNLCLF